MQNDHIVKVRMDSATLDLMERAREPLELDKSKFVRQSVRQMAEAVIAERESTRFGAEDWRRFFALIEKPPEPVAILRHCLIKGPPSPERSTPTRFAAGSSVGQIRVSSASSWQKKNRRSSNPRDRASAPTAAW